MIERDVPDSARVQRRQSRSPRRSPTPKTSHVRMAQPNDPNHDRIAALKSRLPA
jgi:hypothetical protein